MTSKKNLKSALESMMFVWGQPLDAKTAADVCNSSKQEVYACFKELQEEYEQEGRGIRIREVNGAFQFATPEETADYIERLCTPVKTKRLSQSALEVLAIIAYYQPTTRAYVDQVRGVDSSYTVGLLLDRHLIEECGRLQVPGRPRLYRTTKAFLRAFHLNSLEDLPEMPGLETDGQLRIAEPDGAAQPEE